MASVTVKNYDLPNEKSDTVHVEGWIAHSPDDIEGTLAHILGAYRAMWPNNELLKKIHIVKLP